MSTGKTVAGAAGANATAMTGTDAALPVVPFLDAPLWFWEIGGTQTMMTPQALIVVTTGILSVVALMTSIVKKARK